MPTENSELIPGKVFIKTKEDEEPKELKAIDISAVTIEIPKEKVKQIFKMHGLNKITRKRFKKLLMGCGMQRNDAEIVANAFRESEIQYTPLAVQKVIETINMEAEKEEQ